MASPGAMEKMLISVTGICNRAKWRLRKSVRHHRNGFTLIEVLVVVMIVSIVATMALLSMNFGESRKDQEEARRLVALVKLASQQAIISGSELALEVAKDGYRFLKYHDQQWTTIEDRELRPREMPGNIELETYIYGGMASEDSNSDNKNSDETLPRIYILSSGELTPFKIVVSGDAGSLYRVTGDAGGRVEMSGQ